MNGFKFEKLYRESSLQLFRYVIVGLATNISGYLVYLLLTSMGTTPKITITILYSIGAAIGFVGNKKFTFSDKGGVLGSGIRYATTHLFGFLLNFLTLMVFVDKLGYPHQLVQGIAIFVVAGFLFVCFKLFVFRDASNSKAKESMPMVSAPMKNKPTRKAWLQRNQRD